MTGSGFFETMLTGDFEEKDSEVICLGDTLSFDALDILVKFLYTDTLKPTQDVPLEELICAADYLQMEDAVQELSGQIREAISKSNVLRFWNLRNMIKDSETITAIRTFILGHFKDIVLDISFLKLDLETISWILESDELEVASEVDVFRAIKLWINHDYAGRHKHFLPLLGCVRYDKQMPVSGRGYEKEHSVT